MRSLAAWGMIFFRGRGGVDTLNGGGGNDMASYDQDATNGGSAPVVVNLSSADVNYGGVVTAGTARDGFGDVDTLISIEQARGTAFADIFIGGSTGGFFQGRAGADTYIGTVTLFADNFFGVPFVDYRQDGGTSGINVNLNTGTGTDTFGATETFQNIASIRGSMFADTITGSQFYNYFQDCRGLTSLMAVQGMIVSIIRAMQVLAVQPAFPSISLWDLGSTGGGIRIRFPTLNMSRAQILAIELLATTVIIF